MLVTNQANTNELKKIAIVSLITNLLENWAVLLNPAGWSFDQSCCFCSVHSTNEEPVIVSCCRFSSNDRPELTEDPKKLLDVQTLEL